jgi:hypothetical protein
MPFGCKQLCNFNDGFYLDGTTCKACSTLTTTGTPSQNQCRGCVAAGGFILVYIN